VALQRIAIQVSAKGTQGNVQGANVNISCTAGKFLPNLKLWVEDTTDTNGEVSFWWIAPDTTNETSTLNVTFTAQITSGGDSIQITSDPSAVYDLHSSTITVYANSSTYPNRVENATVKISCDEGKFVDSGTATTTKTTDFSGVASAIWVANLSIVIAAPLQVNITVFISFTGKIVNITLAKTITVYPLDLDSSTLEVSDTAVGGGYLVTVQARAVGNYGPVSQAEIFLDALDGSFSNGKTNITGFANSTGYFDNVWVAPEVSSDVNITITAVFRFTNTPLIKEVNVTILVQSFMHDFDQILWEVNATTVIVGSAVHLQIQALNEIGQAVSGANATFSAPEGSFVGSSTNSIEITTDLTGNASSVTIHVNPETLKLVTDSTADPTSITNGANVTITVHVTAGGQAVEGASVQITAQSGVFAESNSEIGIKNTDSSGDVTFIWVTKDMVLTKAKDFVFTIQASFPGYEASDAEQLTVHVEPISTTTQPTGGLTQSQLLGIVAGAAGGVLLLGLIGYFVLRKKPIG